MYTAPGLFFCPSHFYTIETHVRVSQRNCWSMQKQQGRTRASFTRPALFLQQSLTSLAGDRLVRVVPFLYPPRMVCLLSNRPHGSLTYLLLNIGLVVIVSLEAGRPLTRHTRPQMAISQHQRPTGIASVMIEVGRDLARELSSTVRLCHCVGTNM